MWVPSVGESVAALFTVCGAADDECLFVSLPTFAWFDESCALL